jgi:hypothetical protein
MEGSAGGRSGAGRGIRQNTSRPPLNTKYSSVHCWDPQIPTTELRDPDPGSTLI